MAGQIASGGSTLMTTTGEFATMLASGKKPLTLVSGGSLTASVPVPTAEQNPLKLWRSKLGKGYAAAPKTTTASELNLFHATLERLARLVPKRMYASVLHGKEGTIRVWWGQNDPEGAAAWDANVSPVAPIAGSALMDNAQFVKVPMSFTPLLNHIKRYGTLTTYKPSEAEKNSVLGMSSEPVVDEGQTGGSQRYIFAPPPAAPGAPPAVSDDGFVVDPGQAPPSYPGGVPTEWVPTAPEATGPNITRYLLLGGVGAGAGFVGAKVMKSKKTLLWVGIGAAAGLAAQFLMSSGLAGGGLDLVTRGPGPVQY